MTIRFQPDYAQVNGAKFFSFMCVPYWKNCDFKSPKEQNETQKYTDSLHCEVLVRQADQSDLNQPFIQHTKVTQVAIVTKKAANWSLFCLQKSGLSILVQILTLHV